MAASSTSLLASHARRAALTARWSIRAASTRSTTTTAASGCAGNGASRATRSTRACPRRSTISAFAYEDGDVAAPALRGRAALRGCAAQLFFTYRGAFFWRMQAGMGDVVFAPLYEVLQAARRALRVLPSPAQRRARDGATAGEHATSRRSSSTCRRACTAAASTSRSSTCDGLPCWPSAGLRRSSRRRAPARARARDFESHWEQRRAGDADASRSGATSTSSCSASGVGALPHVCARAGRARRRAGATMVDAREDGADAGVPVWLRRAWASSAGTHAPVNLSGLRRAVRHLGRHEPPVRRGTWRDAARPIAYFCSVLPDAGGRDAATPSVLPRSASEVRRNADPFLDRDVGHLWPGAVRATGGFRWELLVAPTPATRGAQRERARFDTSSGPRTSTRATATCCRCPGSIAYRISPLDMTLRQPDHRRRLDRRGFNAGCVEAAVMSGRLAATRFRSSRRWRSSSATTIPEHRHVADHERIARRRTHRRTGTVD